MKNISLNVDGVGSNPNMIDLYFLDVNVTGIVLIYLQVTNFVKPDMIMSQVSLGDV